MRLPALDSLRGIFALAIVLLHSPVYFHLVHSPLVRNAWVFVDYFFVLSGFVISLAYGERIRGRRGALRFIILRIGRLWPLHAFMLALMLGLIAVKLAAARLGLFSADLGPLDGGFLSYLLQDLLLVNVFRNEALMILNFPSWSINAEFWAYGVFALFCMSGLPMRVLASAAVAMGFLVLSGVVEPGFGAAWGWGLFRAVFFFFLGYFTFLAWKALRQRDVSFGTGTEILVAAAVLALVLGLQHVPLPDLVAGLVFCAGIVVFAIGGGPVSRLLCSAPMRVIGDRSYSIYLTHIFVFSILGTAMRAVERVADVTLTRPGMIDGIEVQLAWFGSTTVMDLYVIFCLALVVWFSGLTRRFVELPGQRLARRIVDGRPSGTVPAAEGQPQRPTAT